MLAGRSPERRHQVLKGEPQPNGSKQSWECFQILKCSGLYPTPVYAHFYSLPHVVGSLRGIGPKPPCTGLRQFLQRPEYCGEPSQPCAWASG